MVVQAELYKQPAKVIEKGNSSAHIKKIPEVIFLRNLKLKTICQRSPTTKFDLDANTWVISALATPHISAKSTFIVSEHCIKIRDPIHVCGHPPRHLSRCSDADALRG